MKFSYLSCSFVCESIYRSVSQKHFSHLPFSQKQTSLKGERAVKGNSFADRNFPIYQHFFFLESRMRSQPRKSVGSFEIKE